MKRFIAAATLVAACGYTHAADVTVTCIGAESDDCPVAVDVNLNFEQLIGRFENRPIPNGPVEITRLYWCSGTTFSEPRWSTQQCTTFGRFRVVKGDLTKRQLADGKLAFEVVKLHTYCRNDEITKRPICTANP